VPAGAGGFSGDLDVNPKTENSLIKIFLRLALAALVALSAGSQLACSGSETNAEEANAGSEDSQEKTGKGEKGDETEEPKAVPVEVVALDRGAIEETLRYSTNLEAEDEVAVFAESSRRVVELRVEEGRRVAKGQVLLRLQDDEQRTTLAKVQSQYDNAAREYERQTRLHGQELISEQAFNDATYELEQLALALEEAERALSYTEVKAPISGTVTERLVNLGDFVNVNQKLFHIVDFGSLVARVFVPEKELRRIAAGQRARVTATALGDAAIAGTIDRLSPVVDPHSGTVKVTVDVPPAGGLRPGLYVDVELVTAVRDDALLVPKRALVYDQDQVYVYRIGDGMKAERVLLEPLLEDKNHIEPAGGVASGDRVVVAGQAGLKDGVEVRLVGAGETTAGTNGRLEEPAPAAEPAK
jgi:membrane fusion protein (multidrug efflux system)